MRPRDSSGKVWHVIDSNRILQHLRAKVIDELRARDYARGVPRDGKCYIVVEEGGVQTTRIDPDLSRRKHSGDETNRLLQERWSEFCAEPHDVAVEMATLGCTPTADEGPTMRVAGLDATITRAIAAGIEAGLRGAGLQKRRSRLQQSADVEVTG